MDMFELIKGQMGANVPFAAHAGVRLLEVADGRATAALDQTPQTANHIGSQHAGALFTLAETASGAAMAGAFAAHLLSIRPVAAEAQIRYLKVAKGRILGHAKVVDASESLHAKLAADGKVQFPVEVTLIDEAGLEVAQMSVDWHVRAAKSG